MKWKWDMAASMPGLVFAVFILWTLSQASLRQQAVFLWMVSKFVLALICIMILPMCFVLWLHENRTDLRPVALLALFWLPVLEFITQVTPYQRYLTMARLVLSILASSTSQRIPRIPGAKPEATFPIEQSAFRLSPRRSRPEPGAAAAVGWLPVTTHRRQLATRAGCFWLGSLRCFEAWKNRARHLK